MRKPCIIGLISSIFCYLHKKRPLVMLEEIRNEFVRSFTRLLNFRLQCNKPTSCSCNTRDFRHAVAWPVVSD